MKELLPKEDPKAAAAIFLMGRQAYRGSFKDDAEDLAERTEADKLAALDSVLRNQQTLYAIGEAYIGYGGYHCGGSYVQ